MKRYKDFSSFILVLVVIFALNLDQTVLAKTTVQFILAPSTTIQEAINAANPGDTIYVMAGLYQESIIVNKTLTILGENMSTTIIQANEKDVVQVTANDVYFSGFTVRNGNYGIIVRSSNYTTITGNIVSNNSIGITLEHSSNSIISNNIVINNKRMSIGSGIFLNEGSSNNIVKNNKVLNNGEGIYLRGSDHNIVTRNFISNNTKTGICLMIIKSADYNVLSDNVIEDGATFGIDLWGAKHNAIVNNTLKNNGVGMVAEWSANDNLIFHNSFVDNFRQTYIYQSTNVWDNGFEGNYWSNYNWTDYNLYGILTRPYNVSSGNPINRDFYPLRSLYLWSDANHDGIINTADAELLRSSWQGLRGETGYSPYVDFNQDQIVNIKDATVIGANWLKHI